MNRATTERMRGTTWLGPRRWAPLTLAALSFVTLGLSVTGAGPAGAQTAYDPASDGYSMASVVNSRATSEQEIQSSR